MLTLFFTCNLELINFKHQMYWTVRGNIEWLLLASVDIYKYSPCTSGWLKRPKIGFHLNYFHFHWFFYKSVRVRLHLRLCVESILYSRMEALNEWWPVLMSINIHREAIFGLGSPRCIASPPARRRPRSARSQGVTATATNTRNTIHCSLWECSHSLTVRVRSYLTFAFVYASILR